MAKRKEVNTVTKTLQEYSDSGVPVSVCGKDFHELKFRTNVLTLDYALDGGVPLGRICEIFGAEGTGKSTLGMQILKAAEMNNLPSVLIDMERTYTAAYGKLLGLNKTIITRPNYGEQAFQMMIDLIKSGYKILMIDSVASMIPKAEIEEEEEANSLGLMARMMSR